MTDTEIKKALNEADGLNHIGIICMDKTGENITLVKATDIVDLINRLESEADKYYNAAKIQQNVSMKRHFEIKRLTEENERLKRLFKESEANEREAAKRFYKMGVKDFAAKLRDFYTRNPKYYRPNAHTLINFLFGLIDEFESKLTGEAK